MILVYLKFIPFLFDKQFYLVKNKLDKSNFNLLNNFMLLNIFNLLKNLLLE